MFEKRSSVGELSTYDWYATGRSVLFFFLTVAVANIEIIKTQLVDWGVAPVWIALFAYALIDLGRRFLTNYK